MAHMGTEPTTLVLLAQRSKKKGWRMFFGNVPKVYLREVAIHALEKQNQNGVYKNLYAVW